MLLSGASSMSLLDEDEIEEEEAIDFHNVPSSQVKKGANNNNNDDEFEF